jgi:hypothetical protein
MKDNHLESALKSNRAKQILGQWKAALSSACAIQLSNDDFLGPEETAILKAQFFSKVRHEGGDTVNLNWPKGRLREVLDYLEDICIEVGESPVVLFSSVDHLIGAVRVPADRVLGNAMSVWEVVKNDLCLATEDLAGGLCVEQNYYDLQGEYVAEGVYELTGWGDFSQRQH